VSRDGTKPSDFHGKYDNKGVTISVATTADGSVLGGYTPVSWELKGGGSAQMFNHSRSFPSFLDGTIRLGQGDNFKNARSQFLRLAVLVDAQYSQARNSSSLFLGETQHPQTIKDLEVFVIAK